MKNITFFGRNKEIFKQYRFGVLESPLVTCYLPQRLCKLDQAFLIAQKLKVQNSKCIVLSWDFLYS